MLKYKKDLGDYVIIKNCNGLQDNTLASGKFNVVKTYFSKNKSCRFTKTEAECVFTFRLNVFQIKTLILIIPMKSIPVKSLE